MPATLIADGAEVAVLRSLAAFSYGIWGVQYPEGFTPGIEDTLDEDRQWGYIALLGDKPEPFGRRFVRRDVKIDAEAKVSDVESVLDTAAETTSGDVILSREISTGGLGSLIPHEDFDVGDIVQVKIWDHVIPLPVSKIDAVTDGGAHIGWSVHVGGQLVSQTKSLDEATRETERRIAQERRERLKTEGETTAVATQARSAAQSAETAATTAVKKSDIATTTATEAKEIADNTARTMAKEARALALATNEYHEKSRPFSQAFTKNGTVTAKIVKGELRPKRIEVYTIENVFENTGLQSINLTFTAATSGVLFSSGYSQTRTLTPENRSFIIRDSDLSTFEYQDAVMHVYPQYDFQFFLTKYRRQEGLE